MSTDRADLPVLDMGDPAFWQDIHTPLGSAMEQAPMAMTTDGVLYALRHAEVDAVLKDPRFLAADLLAMMGLSSGPVWEWWASVMFSKNPPEHTRLRSLVSRAFTPKAVERMRPSVRAHAEEILVPAAEAGRLDAQGDLGHRLPLSVMSDVLGIPEADREIFADWTTSLGLAFNAALDPAVNRQVEDALAQLDEYANALIADRRQHPGDDFLSALIAAEENGDRLSAVELVTMVKNLMFAGHDTTRGAMAAMVMLFAQHPDQWERVRADRSLVPQAVDEVLRAEAITTSTSRLASDDAEVGGVAVAKGETVGVCLPAASRDPRRYPNPNTFDVTRKDVRPPTFGAGVHYCLGATLARAELEEALTVLLDHCSALVLEEEPRWMPYAFIRRFESSLWTTLETR